MGALVLTWEAGILSDHVAQSQGQRFQMLELDLHFSSCILRPHTRQASIVFKATLAVASALRVTQRVPLLASWVG
jgi:hypothetical protein